jgi:hypothetical protein
VNNWQDGEAVELGMTGDELLWWRLSLSLIISRSVPEYFDDDDVSYWLHRLRNVPTIWTEESVP